MTKWDPTSCDDPALLRKYMENVRGKRADLYAKAFRRLCELEGIDSNDPVVVEFWRAVTALEQYYLEKHGKRVKATRLRKKEASDGELVTLEYLAGSETPSDGFAYLIEAGMPEFTAEYIVARWPDRFQRPTVERALARLREYGISPPRG